MAGVEQEQGAEGEIQRATVQVPKEVCHAAILAGLTPLDIALLNQELRLARACEDGAAGQDLRALRALPDSPALQRWPQLAKLRDCDIYGATLPSLVGDGGWFSDRARTLNSRPPVLRLSSMVEPKDVGSVDFLVLSDSMKQHGQKPVVASFRELYHYLYEYRYLSRLNCIKDLCDLSKYWGKWLWEKLWDDEEVDAYKAYNVEKNWCYKSTNSYGEQMFVKYGRKRLKAFLDASADAVIGHYMAAKSDSVDTYKAADAMLGTAGLRLTPLLQSVRTVPLTFRVHPETRYCLEMLTSRFISLLAVYAQYIKIRGNQDIPSDLITLFEKMELIKYKAPAKLLRNMVKCCMMFVPAETCVLAGYLTLDPGDTVIPNPMYDLYYDNQVYTELVRQTWMVRQIGNHIGDEVSFKNYTKVRWEQITDSIHQLRRQFPARVRMTAIEHGAKLGAYDPCPPEVCEAVMIEYSDMDSDEEYVPDIEGMFQYEVPRLDGDSLTKPAPSEHLNPRKHQKKKERKNTHDDDDDTLESSEYEEEEKAISKTKRTKKVKKDLTKAKEIKNKKKQRQEDLEVGLDQDDLGESSNRKTVPPPSTSYKKNKKKLTDAELMPPPKQLPPGPRKPKKVIKPPNTHEDIYTTTENETEDDYAYDYEIPVTDTPALQENTPVTDIEVEFPQIWTKEDEISDILSEDTESITGGSITSLRNRVRKRAATSALSPSETTAPAKRNTNSSVTNAIMADFVNAVCVPAGVQDLDDNIMPDSPGDITYVPFEPVSIPRNYKIKGTLDGMAEVLAVENTVPNMIRPTNFEMFNRPMRPDEFADTHLRCKALKILYAMVRIYATGLKDTVVSEAAAEEMKEYAPQQGVVGTPGPAGRGLFLACCVVVDQMYRRLVTRALDIPADEEEDDQNYKTALRDDIDTYKDLINRFMLTTKQIAKRSFKREVRSAFATFTVKIISSTFTARDNLLRVTGRDPVNNFYSTAQTDLDPYSD
ncbi:protein ORF97 [Cyprinid herpesvirus 1]|uniref:Protein ORF97 n=1 Tax=Cyprinid herpesvirus 1 TaxID=317858 RepID=K7PBD6_9VIRU|nr:protein ORF97 [Cyprinid herpesvirus 1]AFJ20394.1 protein ORF97 [Cyprinid herpesvirus 1]